MLLLFGLQLLALPPLVVFGGGLFVLKFVAPNREWSSGAIVTAAIVALLSVPGAWVLEGFVAERARTGGPMGDDGLWFVLVNVGVPVLAGLVGLCLVWATSKNPAR